MLRILNFILIIFLFFFSIVYAETINVFDFTKEELSTLKVRKVRGAEAETKYTQGNNEDGKDIRAEENNKASGLGKERKSNYIKTTFRNRNRKVDKD